MGRKLIVANWKMYLTLSRSTALAKRISKEASRLRSKNNISIVLCPSFVALEEVGKVLRSIRAHGRLRRPTSNGITLGAQDMEPEKRGAYTGEVGLDDLRSLHVEYVLVGHSERRRYFKETDALVNQKLRATLKAGMRPVLCVGEPWSVRRRGMEKVHRYIGNQVRRGLYGVSKKDLKRVVIAYEPVWAIGTGRADSPEDASKMHSHIRKVVPARIPVLYGGSVSSKNAAEFVRAPYIDGLLVGHAGTMAREFSAILRAAKNK